MIQIMWIFKPDVGFEAYSRLEIDHHLIELMWWVLAYKWCWSNYISSLISISKAAKMLWACYSSLFGITDLSAYIRISIMHMNSVERQMINAVGFSYTCREVFMLTSHIKIKKKLRKSEKDFLTKKNHIGFDQ